jgi:PAS domain S-box-containing protein
MQSKQAGRQKMPRRANSTQHVNRHRERDTIEVRRSKKSIPAAPQSIKRTSGTQRKFPSDAATGQLSKNGAPIHSMRRPATRSPKTELEAATQRFVDLYDFAPIAYISFDRAGRIEETNLAAAELLGVPRDLLIGRPFAFYVADLDLFLHHLLNCRTMREQVATELELKPRKGERIHARLLSTPITSTTQNGALLYQTAIVDLSQSRRHEQQLAEKARLLDLSNDAIIVRDVDDRITYWNKGATKIYGYSPPKALGKVSHDLLKAEYPEPLSRIHQKLLRDDHWEGELVHTRCDGTRITVFSRWALDRDAQGKRASVLETNNDITEHKKAQEKIAEAARQQASLYRLAQRSQTARSLGDVYAAALEGITSALHTDRASILLFDNKQAMRFVAWQGLSATYRKAVAGHSPWKASTKNPKPVCIADMRLADISKSLKRTMRCEDIRAAAFIPLVIRGNLIGKFMIYYRVPHVFPEAELDLAMTIARQLAQAIQHEKDEEALRESEARLRATVEQATAGMAHSDPSGRIVFANHRLCQMLGYTDSELIGKKIGDVTHPDDLKENIALFRQLMRGGKSFEMEKRYVRKDGSVLWGHVSVSPVRDADGEITSAVAVAVDVTARKEAEAALQRSNELLERRVRERTRELRRANAELQSEMRRRKGLEGEILSVSDREQQRLGQELHDGLCQHLTAVAFMARSIAVRLRDHRVVDAADIERVAELVNKAAVDTRNLSRALHRVDVDAAGIIPALRDLVDREIWRTSCRLEVKPSFRIDDDAQAAHLYRIAREAVINANKHARARQITVRLERFRQGMVLRVIDDGIGFPKNLKPQQGLGYHIMNYRAQLMGGRLEIDSPQSGGTCVSCYLPTHAVRSNRGPNGDGPVGAGSQPSGAPVARDLTLRHLARQGAANA